jgi:hypothetical protein
VTSSTCFPPTVPRWEMGKGVSPRINLGRHYDCAARQPS